MWNLVIGPIFEVINKLIPDPQAKAAAQLKLIEMQQNGEFKELEKRYEAIIAEAKSTDPYTSRARPSFMYVFYFVIISLVVIAPALGVANPEEMKQFFANVKYGFDAIPEALWWTFSAGYLGYTTSRSYDKKIEAVAKK